MRGRGKARGGRAGTRKGHAPPCDPNMKEKWKGQVDADVGEVEEEEVDEGEEEEEEEDSEEGEEEEEEENDVSADSSDGESLGED
jgi:hypothetical protein